MDEFAMGGFYRKFRIWGYENSHDTSRVAGGSSGGSAAPWLWMELWRARFWILAASRQALRGSDLSRPYGAISRFGLMSMGSSLDQIGSIAKTVEDGNNF